MNSCSDTTSMFRNCFTALWFLSIALKGFYSLKYKFVSQSSVYEKTQQHEDVAAKAVDGDLFTHTQTAGHGSNNNWTVVFHTERNISCFTIVVREGKYKILVNSTKNAFVEFCDEFNVSGIRKENISRCCSRPLTGDSFIIVRKDSGPLRLFEVFLSDCSVGYYGYNCSKCSNSCQTCESTNGKCLSCVDPSKCGDYCNKPCQSKFSNTEFDVKAGICSSCVLESILNRQIGEDYGTSLSEQNCSWSCRQTCTEINNCNGDLNAVESFQAPGSLLCNIECEGLRTNCIVCATNKSDNVHGCLKNDFLPISEDWNILSVNLKCFEKNVTIYCKNRTSFATKDFARRMPSNDTRTDPMERGMDTRTLLLLFAMIILVLSLILLLIKRLKIMRETKRFHLEHFRQVAEPEGENDHEDQRQPHPTFGDGANSIFLVEIADADEVVEDGMERLNVEYTNTIAYRVPVDDFVKYHGIRRENQINEEEEFSKIPTGLMELYKVAVQKDNVSKNRYRYVYPYDFCRVVLNTSGEEGSNDYINACYVEGVEVERAYIAAQGPFTPETLDDFWKMAWQENSSRIVMLTNLFEGDTMKCLKYWPNDVMEFGDIVVRLESQEEYEMYTIRHMTMHQDDVVKAVTQFHFTGWPDRGVPETVDSLLRFRDLVKNDRPEQDGPIIIHCSAGIGRTGTFIALDYLLDEGAAKESVDVINCVSKLRQQRAHSIQTKEQYIYLYDALAQGLKHIRRKPSCRLIDEI